MRRHEMADRDYGSSLLPEIQQNVDQLFRSCLNSLERSFVLWQAAREMSTAAARDKCLSERGQLVSDVAASIERLGASLDHLQTAALKADRTHDLAEIREALEIDLTVAQHVDQRMEELDEHLALNGRLRLESMRD